MDNNNTECSTCQSLAQRVFALEGQLTQLQRLIYILLFVTLGGDITPILSSLL